MPHLRLALAQVNATVGDLPGNGITIDENAIAANQRTGTRVPSEGPHVRSHRAGLRLVTDAPTGGVDG